MAFPATYNFSYYRGDTNQFVIRPKNSDGSAFDLDGYDADFFILPPEEQQQALFSMKHKP